MPETLLCFHYLSVLVEFRFWPGLHHELPYFYYLRQKLHITMSKSLGFFTMAWFQIGKAILLDYHTLFTFKKSIPKCHVIYISNSLFVSAWMFVLRYLSDSNIVFMGGVSWTRKSKKEPEVYILWLFGLQFWNRHLNSNFSPFIFVSLSLCLEFPLLN